MLTFWAVTLFFLTAITLLGQAIYVAIFARVMQGTAIPDYANATLPAAAIVVCVRGNDPSLGECLSAALNQDYSIYTVHVVIDNQDDPAVGLVQELADEDDKLKIHFLEYPSESCSLKCSSLIQVCQTLDSETTIALLDADSIPRPGWLKTLACSLMEPGVGAVTGIRCFTPADSNVGSLVRYTWNSAAIVQMLAYGIPWGGTLAIKAATIAELNLIEAWSGAFCEDTMLADKLKEHDLAVHVVPSLVMPNSESCSLFDFYSWCSRQLLTVKLYHQKWNLVVAYAWLTTLLTLAAPATLILAIAAGIAGAVAWSVATVIVLQIANVAMLMMNERSVRHQLALTNQSVAWLDNRVRFKLFLLIPVTQIVYFAATIRTLAAKLVTWRQIEYRIDGPEAVKRMNYQVFKTDRKSTDSL